MYASRILYAIENDEYFELVELLNHCRAEGTLLDVLNKSHNGYDATPLHAACRYGRRKMVYRGNKSPLYVASTNGQHKLVKLLCKHHWDLKDSNTSLMVAAKMGYCKVVKCLLQMKADAKMLDPEDRSSPLHVAATDGNQDIVRELQRYKADIDVQTYGDEETALHQACSSGHLHVVRLLVKYGANVNACSIYGYPVYEAYQAEHMDIVQYQLQHGANMEKSPAYASLGLLALSIEKKDPTLCKAVLNAKAQLWTQWDDSNDPYIYTDRDTPVQFAIHEQCAEIQSLLQTAPPSLQLQEDRLNVLMRLVATTNAWEPVEFLLQYLLDHLELLG